MGPKKSPATPASGDCIGYCVKCKKKQTMVSCKKETTTPNKNGNVTIVNIPGFIS